jgi:Tir chaperone protein (CesT) family
VARVFVEANSVPIYVRGLADGALTLRSPLGTLVEGPDDQYLKLLLYANCGLVVTKGAAFCLDRNGRLSLERTFPGGLVAAELSRVYRRFAEAAVSWSGLVRSQSIGQPSPTARTDCPISTFWRKHAQSRQFPRFRLCEADRK